jgi:hypothetical protein
MVNSLSSVIDHFFYMCLIGIDHFETMCMSFILIPLILCCLLKFWALVIQDNEVKLSLSFDFSEICEG